MAKNTDTKPDIDAIVEEMKVKFRDGHITNGVITSMGYFTDTDCNSKIEKILREEFGLVDEVCPPGLPKQQLVLVYEKDGYGTGLYRVHFNERDGKSLIQFSYWSWRMNEEDWVNDPMRSALKRIYQGIGPEKVCGAHPQIEVDVPWEIE